VVDVSRQHYEAPTVILTPAYMGC